MNEKKYSYDVFISYWRHDGKIHNNIKAFTEILKEKVISGGKHDFRVFIDKEILLGDPFKQVIEDAIDGSQIFIPIVTESYLRSPWCQLEFNKFYKLLNQDKRRKIIPILWNKHGIETCKNDMYNKIFELQGEDFTEPCLIRHEITKKPVPGIVYNVMDKVANRICEILR